MISNARAGGRPEPSPSKLSASPSSCNPPVNTIPAITASIAAITGGQSCCAARNTSAWARPSSRPTAPNHAGAREKSSADRVPPGRRVRNTRAARAPRIAQSRFETPAASKLAMSVIIAAAARSSGQASSAPVPSPSRMSSDNSGSASRYASKALCPDS